ncbi:response regulator [Bacillus salipaludis]|uniref:Response regulator n=1 Tax=Bacillus salipaludis TaxID=2547811 RepID=A0A4R5VRN9_9BACI|nr:response regulator [Bacillus salipaludis]
MFHFLNHSTLLYDSVTAAAEENVSGESIGEASNGKEAIEIANECKPDVILMDVQMPIMSGIEATTAILN